MAGCGKVLTVLFAAIIFNGGSFGQPLSRQQLKSIENMAQSVMACRKNVGLTLALVTKNETVLTRAYGVRDKERNLPMTTETPSCVGSVTKAFTATLVADGVGRHWFDWDTPLRDVIPDFFLQGEFRSAQASVRDALSHTTGFSSFAGATLACLNSTRKDLVNRLRYLPPTLPFRSQFLYSNYNFLLAARALEVKSGSTWEQLMRERIFEPLGMSSTRLSAELVSEEDWNEAAFSHSVGPGGDIVRNPDDVMRQSLDEIGPAGSVYASADDMAKWMKYHLNEGKNEKGEMPVDSTALKETYKARSTGNMAVLPSQTRPTYPVDDIILTYAMGWFNGMYRGHRKLEHAGGWSSYASRLTLLPDSGLGVFVHVNGPDIPAGYTSVNVMTMFLLDTLLGEEPWLNTTTVCSYPEPWTSSSFPIIIAPPSNSSSSVPLQAKNEEKYTGVYTNRVFGDFIIFATGGGSLRYRFGLFLHGDLKPTATEDTLQMSIEFPLNYTLPSFIKFNLVFDGSDIVDKVHKYHQVKAAFIEPTLPQVFERKTASTSPVFRAYVTIMLLSLAVSAIL